MSQSVADSKGGPTPIRRSTRLGTASIADSQVQSIATTNATPSKGGARRKGALPKVKARESKAFGASGRLGAAEQLSVPVTGFAQAFEAQRAQAVARDVYHDGEESGSEDRDELATSERRTPARSTARSRQTESLRERSYQSSAPAGGLVNAVPSRTYERYVPSRSSSPEVDYTASATPSVVDTSKSFGMEREAGMSSSYSLRANGLAQARRGLDLTSHQHLPPPLFRAEATSQTNTYSSRFVPQRPQAEYTQPLPTNGRPVTTSKPNGFAAFSLRRNQKDDDGEEEEDIEGWWERLSDAGHYLKWPLYALGLILVALLFTTPKAKHMMRSVAERVHWDSRPSFNFPGGPRTTPTDDFVGRHGKGSGEPAYEPIIRRLLNKQTELERSLQTLEKDLPQYVLVARRKDGSLEINDDFWRALLSKLRSESMPGLDDYADVDIDWNAFMQKNRHKMIQIMSDEIRNSDVKGEFELVARGEFTKLMKQEYARLSKMIDQRVEEAAKAMSRTVAKDAAGKAFRQEIHLQSLALANLVANAELNIRKVNYFSPGLGARIHPDIRKTSPTYEPSTYTSTFKNVLHKYVLQTHQTRPPIAALERWDEPGDCWCVAPDDHGLGLAQLTILLGHPTLPRQITVEHLPKSASLDHTAAPKDIEIWAESTESRAAAMNCGPEPRPGHICLGKFSYNVHADNHIQTFDLDAILTKPVKNMVVRVLNNWGSDHTCIYRLRLHGERVE